MTGATKLNEAGQPGTPGIVLSTDGLGLVERLRRGSSSLAHDTTMQEAAREIEQLLLAEEGAKTAFAHVVDSKRDLERENTKLRNLLDAAYADIRRRPVGDERRHIICLCPDCKQSKRPNASLTGAPRQTDRSEPDYQASGRNVS